MCQEELCGEPRTRHSLAGGKGGQDGGEHQQNFVKKTRTRITRCAGAKDNWTCCTARPRCELLAIASCQSCIQRNEYRTLFFSSLLCLPFLTAGSLKMSSFWLPTLQCHDRSQHFDEILLPCVIIGTTQLQRKHR